MCEVVCHGVSDRVERQMGTRRSDYDLYTHTHTHKHARTRTHKLLQSIYNACDIYEQPNHPKKLELSTVSVEKKGDPSLQSKQSGRVEETQRVSPKSPEKLM